MPQGESIASATVFKGTTLPHVVVKRKIQLYSSGFVTFQSDKGVTSGKFWPFHRRCQLDPPDAALIKAHERHLRKAGPLRAVASYARDKNVLKLVRSGAARGHAQLWCFGLLLLPSNLATLMHQLGWPGSADAIKGQLPPCMVRQVRIHTHARAVHVTA